MHKLNWLSMLNQKRSSEILYTLSSWGIVNLGGNRNLRWTLKNGKFRPVRSFYNVCCLSLIARLTVAVWLGGFLVSCQSEQTVTKTQVKKDAWGNKENYSVGKDKDGNPMMKSDLRSSMEGKMNHMSSNRDFSGDDYTKKSYRKERWGGDTIFNRKKYGGDTDASRFKNEPWFARKQASASKQQAAVSGKTYGVNPFTTRKAHEEGAATIARPSDAETAVRRRVYKQPDITHWLDQSKLSVNDTKSRLGR